MAETRRERKKLRTRQLLVDTAFRLFAQQGYEQTTIAQIATTADVAKQTFFNHFPTKEDVLFADAERFYDATTEVIAERMPDEHVADLLLRIYDRVIARRLTDSPPPVGDGELLDIMELATEVPAIQAKALQVASQLQQRIAEALTEAFPDVLDPVTAAAAVGSLMGAAQAAATVSLRLGHSPDEYHASVRRAQEIVANGLRTL